MMRLVQVHTTIEVELRTTFLACLKGEYWKANIS